MCLALSLLQRIKRKFVGEEGRCRCYERQESNLKEIEDSHTLGGTVIHTSIRESHGLQGYRVRDCTCTTRVVVKSIHCTVARTVIFFSPFRPSFTPFVTLPSRVQDYFFFLSTKKTMKETPCQNNLKTRRGKHRNVFTRCGEGHQTGVALVRGLPYNSRRHGDQRSLEKYAHGRESQTEG